MVRQRDEREHYSVSQLVLFSLCPKKYQYMYVDKLPYVPVYNLESGKALHGALEANNNEIKDSHVPLTPDQITELAVSLFKQENSDRIEDADFDLAEGADMLVGDINSPLEKYKEEHEPMLRDQGIIAAEEKFEITLGGKLFIGYTDVITNSVVADYKLLGRKKNRQAVDMDPQLVVYEAVTGKRSAFLQFIRKRSRAELEMPRRRPRITKAIMGWANKQVENIESAKKTGLFPPVSPVSWVCKSCQFRYKCWGME